jgi:hypothetical protein
MQLPEGLSPLDHTVSPDIGSRQTGHSLHSSFQTWKMQFEAIKYQVYQEKETAPTWAPLSSGTHRPLPQ